MKNVVLVLVSFFLLSCSSKNSYVVSTANTVIGIDVGQDPITQFPKIRMGMCRSFFTAVPIKTNDTMSFAAAFNVNVGLFSGIQISDKIAINTNGESNSLTKAIMETTNRFAHE